MEKNRLHGSPPPRNCGQMAYNLCKVKYSTRPASVALLVVSQYALPGYNDQQVWVRAQAGPIIVSGYSGVCFEIKFSGRHRGFDGVLFNL